MRLQNKKVAILATNGFEKSELFEPLKSLQDNGADVDIVSIEKGKIKSFADGNWDKSIQVDKTIDEVSASDYDSLILPGGLMNPDTLRTNEKALEFTKDFFAQSKPVGAICHAPWILISAGVANNRTMTSYKSIKDDMINAGVNWKDQAVVVDEGLVTSRNPNDLPQFCDKLVEEIAEGKHKNQMVNA